jgi:ElaB/YqjD/DUF883 family membrane-anchored ribosome-binding protein
MDNEADALRQQMEETRAHLTEKLETLEQQLVETVQGATSAVTETVESVKEAVHETVSEVKETVHETVDTVKSTFDLRHQVEQHPWLMFGGAVAVGFLAGRLLGRLLQPQVPAYVPAPPPPPPAPFERQSSRVFGTDGHSLTGNGHAGQPQTETKAEGQEAGGLTALFGKEIDQLKKVAIGTTLGLVRDLVAEKLPEPVRPDVTQILDSVTMKLGGEPGAVFAVDKR